MREPDCYVETRYWGPDRHERVSLVISLSELEEVMGGVSASAGVAVTPWVFEALLKAASKNRASEASALEELGAYAGAE